MSKIRIRTHLKDKKGSYIEMTSCHVERSIIFQLSNNIAVDLVYKKMSRKNFAAQIVCYPK